MAILKKTKTPTETKKAAPAPAPAVAKPAAAVVKPVAPAPAPAVEKPAAAPAQPALTKKAAPEAPKKKSLESSIKVGDKVMWVGETDTAKIATVSRVYESDGKEVADLVVPWKSSGPKATALLEALRVVDCLHCSGTGLTV